MRYLVPLLSAILLGVLPAPRAAAADAPVRYDVRMFGESAGALVSTPEGEHAFRHDFHYRSNGRGPTLVERIAVAPDGGFVRYAVTGQSTYGGAVDESFVLADGAARWKSTADAGDAPATTTPLYLPANGTPAATAALLSAVLASPGQRLPVYPAGELSARELERRTLVGPGGPREVVLAALLGNGSAPELLWLDAKSGALFAFLVPDALQLVEEGWEAHAAALEKDQQARGEALLADFSAGLTHRPDRPLLIRGARVFDSRDATLSAPSDVYVADGRIAAVMPAGSTPRGDIAVIEAAGRTLLPGLWDMHVHFSDWSGPQHLASGVTSVRDMGNVNSLLQRDRANIETGRAMGPNVFAYGVIEGTGENASRGDFMVATLDEAKAAVDWYAQRGYPGIKIYNSFPREHLAATLAHAHSLGLRVAGHVPAFLRAEDAVHAGFDELTHINQVMLNFLVRDGDDTRTLMRFERIMEEGGDLDLQSPAVRGFVAMLAERGIVVDPTLAVFEDFHQLPGQVHPSYTTVIDHLPVPVQRQLRTNTFDVTADTHARNRRGFDRMRDLVGELHRAGVTLVAGTDFIPGFTLHRELELYVEAGLSPGEALRTATWNAAQVMGALERLGSIERGKQADLVLVDGDPTQDIGVIRRPRLVVRNGALFYPDEIHAALGVEPFVPSARLPGR